MRVVASAAELLELSSDDVFVRGSLRRAFVRAWAHGSAIAWVGLDAEEQRSAVCVLSTNPRDGAELVAAIRDEVHWSEAQMTLERPIAPLLDAFGLVLSAPEEWELRWTSKSAEVDLTGDLRWVDDEGQINALLDAHAPHSSARPGDRHVRRWAGGFLGTELVAVAADTTGTPDIGHISSVATSTPYRGAGWAAQVTGWLTQQLLDEGLDAVSLGMFAANTAAIRLYTRLGFTGMRQFVSGRLEHSV